MCARYASEGFIYLFIYSVIFYFFKGEGRGKKEVLTHGCRVCNELGKLAMKIKYQPDKSCAV